ncbi:winged helix-turn-helix domain-containing protein [Cohnella luojiensis]|uniref:Winged helix-turn-helix domain-containing protein n=1 Tax=Cohnella luojiensis TaxID=652876 RepID=A0A4Y8LX48_9BACL|nr:crosslink repair DNA glycosylase YcaQ family protein [Cohnella luojiensis]TFE26256.1 winged helix-turn-helix domain-containing protein [Cohnella luojiensis]
MKPIQTTKRALRRFLLETQLLLHPPEKRANSADAMRQRVLDVIRQLECVQIDPVSAVRPNQHLALSARIAGYEPEILNDLLRQNEIFEYMANAACIIPMEDFPIFEPTRQRLKQHVQPHIDNIRPIVEQVLQKLESEGPLTAKSFESDQRVHGYWDNVNAKTKATSHALNLLTDAAQIRIVGREGNQRLFDVIRRSVPAELLLQAEKIDSVEALEAIMQKYFRAYRVFEPSDPRLGWQRLSANGRREAIDLHVKSGEITPVEVSGLNKPYYILASDRDRLSVHDDEDRTRAIEREEELLIRFLSPLDNLLWSRKRLTDLFDFEYRWEIYTPAVKRTYGYYAMPILAGDRLIGRMDPRLDKKQGHLTVQLLQIDPEIDFTEGLRDNVHRALESFAHVHGAETVSIEQSSFG